MIIEKIRNGAYNRNIEYAVCSDATETGSEPREIARFKSRDTAVIVMRYMRGDELTFSEIDHARAAIKNADAPTDQSKSTRKQ